MRTTYAKALYAWLVGCACACGSGPLQEQQPFSAATAAPPATTAPVAPSSGLTTSAASPAAPSAGAGAAGMPAAAVSRPTQAPAAGSSSAMLMQGTQAVAGQPAPAHHDHCSGSELPDPRDMQLQDAPAQWVSAKNGDIDLIMPKLVLDWMSERVWEASHDAWHNVRRCGGGGFGFPGAGSMICSHKELVQMHMECGDADNGYEFLVMHRHMIHALQQAFPKQRDLFAGFEHFPYDAADVPEAWRDRWGNGWASSILSTAEVLEKIEQNLSMFPSEGELGKLIQCGGMANGANSIHGALHFKWVVNDSPYSLGKQTVNIDNYMFWKLHGWIDRIWERYRVAKGLAPDEPKLQQALTQQCQEMDRLAKVVGPSMPMGSTSTLPVEHGEFHERVRPILEKNCASCHSESSPEAGLSLGGKISSADVVKNLVEVPSMHGGQFKRVERSSPANSWLYLKVSGTAMNAGCTGQMCNAQVMPPAGEVTLSAADLATLRTWIEGGAAAPTQ